MKKVYNMENIFNETVFTMEAEGFVMTDKDKSVLLDVLHDKVPYEEQRQIYIEKAKDRGGLLANVNA